MISYFRIFVIFFLFVVFGFLEGCFLFCFFLLHCMRALQVTQRNWLFSLLAYLSLFSSVYSSFFQASSSSSSCIFFSDSCP